MDTRTKVASNFIWRLAERGGAQIVSFVVSIVLARLLDPEVYGTVAIVLTITTILDVFVEGGLGTALIQKKDADSKDFSTVFYFNITACLLLYGLLCLVAPLIAGFYDNPELTPILRVLGLIVVISGVKNIQQAYVSRHMLFRKFFFSTLGGTILSAVVGIVLALKGYGVWALVAQQLTNPAVDTMILWITVRWHPTLEFSFSGLKEMFSYGWKLLVSTLIDRIYTNLNALIIGKLYTEESLAYYNRGDMFPQLIIYNVNTSMDSVLLPAMAEKQDERTEVRNITRRSVTVSTYVLAPLMMGMAFTAPVMVELLLGTKWLACVPYIMIFSVSYMLWPIHTANLNALKAIGRSDLILKLEIAKKVVGLVVLLISMWYGVFAIALCSLITSLVSVGINSYPNRKLLGYGTFTQVKDILPNFILAVLMGAAVYPMRYLSLPLLVIMVLQIACGGVLYLALSKITGNESFRYLWSFYREKRARKV